MTVPPSRPMISAVERPMPRPAAVISATRPWNLMASLLFRSAPRPAGPQPRDGLRRARPRAPDPRPRDLPCQFAAATLPAMKYEMISADCHLDLCWLPPDLFTSKASASLKDRMPYTKEGPRGPVWVTNKGASLGMACGMGSAGREYIPGRIHRSDRMASTGLYEDGKRGIRRITDPDLRLKDQDRDGVQAEVLYGVLGTTGRMNDPEAAVEVLRIYNEWLADFCSPPPDRYAGLASIPNHPLEAAVAEVERVVKRGALRGVDIANSSDLKPLWDPYWNPLWDAIDGCGLPLHFHTIGGGSRPDTSKLAPKVQLAARAAGITNFQMHMADVLLSMIFCGVLEH